MDAFYRLAFLALMLLIVGVMLPFRLRAAQASERIDRSGEGWLLLVSIRVAGAMMLLAALLFLAAPQAIRFAQLPLPAALRWSGLPIALLGIAAMYWTLSHLGRNLTDTVHVRQQAYLVTTGPYAWMRHPMYVALALLVLGFSLLSASGLLLASGAAACALLAVRVSREEQALAARFGGEYEVYRERTGRFLPRWR